MSRLKALRQLIEQKELGFIMEAHSGPSAKVAEDAGFKAIWASSLSISAALAVRDTNEASWTQILEVIEFMADATTVPILLDGDTGYAILTTQDDWSKNVNSVVLLGFVSKIKYFQKRIRFWKVKINRLRVLMNFVEN